MSPFIGVKLYRNSFCFEFFKNTTRVDTNILVYSILLILVCFPS